MSDSIYKWAARELDSIKINGRALDFEHAMALVHVLTTRLSQTVQDTSGHYSGNYAYVYPAIGPMDWDRE